MAEPFYYPADVVWGPSSEIAFFVWPGEAEPDWHYLADRDAEGNYDYGSLPDDEDYDWDYDEDDGEAYADSWQTDFEQGLEEAEEAPMRAVMTYSVSPTLMDRVGCPFGNGSFFHSCPTCEPEAWTPSR